MTPHRTAIRLHLRDGAHSSGHTSLRVPPSVPRAAAREPLARGRGPREARDRGGMSKATSPLLQAPGSPREPAVRNRRRAAAGVREAAGDVAGKCRLGKYLVLPQTAAQQAFQSLSAPNPSHSERSVNSIFHQAMGQRRRMQSIRFWWEKDLESYPVGNIHH